MQTVSAGGARYYIAIVDDYSKFKAVQPIAKKSDAPHFIKTVITNWEAKTGLSTAAIRHDRAKEFMAAEMRDWYQDKGIEMQPTAGYSASENGVAERFNRSVWELVLAMLADCGLPKKWWGEALAHACHLRNVTDSTGGPTPWELVKGELPDLTSLRVFGAPCMVKIPDEKRHKLEFKTEPGRLLGFDLPNTKAYKVLTSSGTVTQSRDVTVNEDFESKADKRMLNSEIDMGIAPTPEVDDTPPPPPAPALPAPALTVDDTPPPPDAAPSSSAAQPPGAQDATLHEESDTEDLPQTGSHHRSSRENKGQAPERFNPASFRLVRATQPRN